MSAPSSTSLGVEDAFLFIEGGFYRDVIFSTRENRGEKVSS